MDGNGRKQTKSAKFRGFLNVCSGENCQVREKYNQIFRLSSESVAMPLALRTSSAVFTSLTRKTT